MGEVENSPSVNDVYAAESRTSAVFLIEAAPGAASLIRVLSPSAVIRADIASIASAAPPLTEPGCSTIWFEALRMEAARAERLARELATLMCVRDVSLILRCCRRSEIVK